MEKSSGRSKTRNPSRSPSPLRHNPKAMSTTSFDLSSYTLRRYRRWVMPVAVMALLTEGAALGCGARWSILIKGLRESLVFFYKLLTPEWGAFSEMLGPAVQTIFIALVGTFGGAVLSLFVGL